MHSEGMYNERVVMQFAVAAVVWGVAGMRVGVVIACPMREAGGCGSL